jgi:hypothetical protein
MGTSTPAGFAVKSRKMAGELGRLDTTTVKIAALAVKTSVLGQLQVAGVKDGKLRGVGKRGAKIGVSSTVAGHTAVVKATGPFHLIERATKPHRIGHGTRSATSGLPLVDRSGQDIKRKVVVIPGVGVRAWADHPGTKGKYPWAKGVTAAQPAIAKANQVAVRQAMVNAFR